ncbi:hypothetical protein CIHG_01509 [Coccidioides immitis H538.4]|uniref:Uncharacterized protein n=2 Tax=Coccidioides immitis TaxID=5501 RepID=A0A0J8RGI7_COCIT|nr:hypothetical protein CIRG_01360 [Coccidioides immitis RMSCC 2394]KMU83726.1 hypothetical protein CIHG_01509 [Coccidioides immitis H538.4]
MTGDTLLISLALMYAINGDQINDREANYGHPPLVKLNGKLECCGSPESRCFRSAWGKLDKRGEVQTLNATRVQVRSNHNPGRNGRVLKTFLKVVLEYSPYSGAGLKAALFPHSASCSHCIVITPAHTPFNGKNPNVVLQRESSSLLDVSKTGLLELFGWIRRKRANTYPIHIGRSFHYRPPKFTVAALKGAYKHGYECDRDKMSSLLPCRANHLTYIPIKPVVEHRISATSCYPQSTALLRTRRLLVAQNSARRLLAS